MSSNYKDRQYEEMEEYCNEQKWKTASNNLSLVEFNDEGDFRYNYYVLRVLTHDCTKDLYVTNEEYKPLWFTKYEELIKYHLDEFNNKCGDYQFRNNVSNLINDYLQKQHEKFDELNMSTSLKELSITKINQSITSQYSDNLNVENKIITTEDIDKIVKMGKKKIEELDVVSKMCEKFNENIFESDFKDIPYKSSGSRFNATIGFNDESDIRVDNFNQFYDIFNNRRYELKSLYINFYIEYERTTPKPNKSYERLDNTFNIAVYQDSFHVSMNLDEKDNSCLDIYQELVNISNNAPEKYDFIIKKRTWIKSIIAFGFGLIPGILLAAVLNFTEIGADTIGETPYLFPVIALIIAFIFGEVFVTFVIGSLYSTIVPNKVYSHYDDKNNKMVYKDDVANYKKYCEVLIGKNTNNMKLREKIKSYYNLSKKLLLVELPLLAIISIIVYVMSTK